MIELASEIEDERQSVGDALHLVERQMCHLLAKRARVDGADHLAHDTRRVIDDRHLWVEARGRCRLRSWADHDGGKGEKVVGLDDQCIASAVLDSATATREDDLMDVTSDHATAP